MSLPATEYQCAVLGDEPGGLWLLKRLGRLMPAWLDKGELLWLRLGPERPRPVASPVRLMGSFDAHFGPPWAAELKLPGHNLIWDAEGLARAFPSLPAPFDLPSISPHPKFPPPYRQAVYDTLRREPELLTYAAGLWKHLGRARRLQAESVVLMALQCRELAWWDAAADVPAEVREEALSPREHPVEAMTMKGGSLQLTFRGAGVVSAKHWILNLSWHQLQTLALTCPALWDAVNERDPRAPRALCPLHVTVDGDALPWTARPLMVLFDTDEIPDVDGEIWPLAVRDVGDGVRELEVWASVARELCLDEALVQLRDAYSRVLKVFPFLDRSTRSLDAPLWMESCFSEAQRREALDRLEGFLVERYDFTSFHSQTRQRGLHSLLPSVHCHLPYPVGTLWEARRLLERFVGKKRLEADESTRAASFPPPLG